MMTVTFSSLTLQTRIQDMESIVVAGGLDSTDSPVSEVEFLDLATSTSWKVMGMLKSPRFGFPTVGRVLGNNHAS